MPHRLETDDPTLPPPGKRSGKGSDSLLPFLKKTLAAKPNVRPQDFQEAHAPRSLGDIDGRPASQADDNT